MCHSRGERGWLRLIALLVFPVASLRFQMHHVIAELRQDVIDTGAQFLVQLLHFKVGWMEGWMDGW